MLSFAMVLGFLLTLLFSILLIPIASKIQLVDKPTERKNHIGSVPLVGGWAMYLAVLTTLLFAYNLSLSSIDYALWFCATLLVIIGSLDDKYDIDFRWRIGVQVLVGAVTVFGAGLIVYDLGNLVGLGNLALGSLGVFFTVWAILGLINAFNMIDGIDGLSAGLGIIALGFIYFSANGDFQPRHEFGFLLLIGALVAYLSMNLHLFPRVLSKIFMGDAGAMLLGFVIAVLAVKYSQGPDAYLKPITILYFVAVPVMDVIVTMIRRVRHGRSPFFPDKTHVHHIFLKAGYSQREALLFILGVQFVVASIGYALNGFDGLEWLSFVGFLGLFFVYNKIINRAFLVSKILSREVFFPKRVKRKEKI